MVLQLVIHLVEGWVQAQVQLMPPRRIGDEFVLRAVQDQIDVVPVQVSPQGVEAILVKEPPHNTVHVGHGT
jgi:hypothetical protein